MTPRLFLVTYTGGPIVFARGSIGDPNERNVGL